MPQRTRSQRLNGLFPLSYLGVVPVSPVNFVIDNRPPNQNDSKNFYIGDLWLDIDSNLPNPPTPENLWMLVSLNSGIATWVNFAGGASNVETLTGDIGGAVGPDGANNINVITNVAIDNAGSTVLISGNPGTNTLTLNVTDAAENTLIGELAGNATLSGTRCTALGQSALRAMTSAADDVIIGWHAGDAITIGSRNVAVGDDALGALTTGNDNIAVGSNAALNYTGAESNNIIIGNPGTLADSAAIRIGTLGTQATCFVQGIAGVSVANELPVVINSATGQLGTGPGVVAIQYTTDSGIAVPAANNLNIFGAHGINTSGSGSTVTVAINNAITLGDLADISLTPALTMASGDISLTDPNDSQDASTIQMIQFAANSGTNRMFFYLNNVFIGQQAGNTTMTAGVALFNIGIGPFACDALTTGSQNIGLGNNALSDLTTGSNNIGMGFVAAEDVTTGSGNVGIGSSTLADGAGNGVTTGSGNIGIGNRAGASLTGANSYNICIGDMVTGTAGNSNTLRIGLSTGAGASQLNRAFIAGIRGITTGVADAVAVLVDSANQLGTVSSSLRYKHNIQDLGTDSEIIYKLRPVKFNYNQHPHVPAWGLIAEEVSETFPQLAVYDKEGMPESVKYHDIPVLLLNELQKLKKRIEAIEQLLTDVTTEIGFD